MRYAHLSPDVRRDAVKLLGSTARALAKGITPTPLLQRPERWSRTQSPRSVNRAMLVEPRGIAPTGRFSDRCGRSTLGSTSEASGAEGDRTPDLMTASHALSQLSYGPGKKGAEPWHKPPRKARAARDQ